MSFLEAIKRGIANAENFKLNQQEAIDIFEEANKAIRDKANRSDLCFIEITENKMSFPNGIVKSITYNSETYYPLTIRTINNEYECGNKNELIGNICEILKSSDFGFYLKRFI